MATFDTTCAICLEDATTAFGTFTAGCGHKMCGLCAITFFRKNAESNKCPTCKQLAFGHRETIVDNGDGTWTQTWPDGATLRGRLENDKFVGECVETWMGGTTIRGVCVDSRFEGDCVMTGNKLKHGIGRAHKGCWVGRWHFTYTNGNSRCFTYERGVGWLEC